MPLKLINSAILSLLLMATCTFCYGQSDVLSTRVSAAQGYSVLAILNEIETTHAIRFFYLEEWLAPFTLSQDYQDMPLRNVLASELRNSDIHFVELYDYAVIFFKDASTSIRRDSIVSVAKDRNRIIESVQVGKELNTSPGARAVINGIVRDQGDGSALAGASVFIEELNTGFSANGEGRFQLIVPPGEYLLQIRFLNYQEKLIHANVLESGTIEVFLSSQAIVLDELVVAGESNLKSSIGEVRINLDALQKAPALLGEPDLIRQIQSQSGVTTVSEASSGFNVRGGSVDQNLILFDGVPIFNTAHALGFLTAFNSNAIQETSFYKGALPAEFGGRISSVLNITSKEGNYQRWEGSGGIGPISSHVYLGGPIKKSKTSIAMSFRSSYSDWVLNELQTRYEDISDASVFFYDGNVKVASKPDPNTRITGSLYFSRDRFSLATDTVNRWNNFAGSLRYDKRITDRLFYTLNLQLGSYNYALDYDTEPFSFNLRYRITYPSIKLDFDRTAAHKQTFGFHITGYNFEPGTIMPGSPESEIRSATLEAERSLESALYFSNKYALSTDVELELGIRLSMYNRIGPEVEYHYEEGRPREIENIYDSTTYRSNQIVKTYVNPEPRISLNLQLGNSSSAKIGFHRANQYLHLITNSATVTPVDIWQSGNSFFKPQRSDQLSVGYFRNSRNRVYEFSAEAYYKKQKNTLEFKDGARLILNNYLETSLLGAEARAYGVELSASKMKGKITGSINYTLSRSLRRVSTEFETEQINDGKWYPSNMDQPHVLNVSWRYSITRRVFVTGNFTYHSGRPISVPVASYAVDGFLVMDFDERNNYRIDDYHRLDLSFVIEGSSKKDKKVESSWMLSLYNVYGRKNPYSVFFVDVGGYALQPYQLSLIGTMVPSVTYQFKF